MIFLLIIIIPMEAGKLFVQMVQGVLQNLCQTIKTNAALHFKLAHQRTLIVLVLVPKLQ